MEARRHEKRNTTQVAMGQEKKKEFEENDRQTHTCNMQFEP